MILTKKRFIALTLLMQGVLLYAGKLTVTPLNPNVPNQAAESIFREAFDGSARDALYSKQSATQIALLQNNVIGIAVYRDFDHDNGMRRRYLYNFAITESERGNGYGKEFMHTLIEQAVAAKNIQTFELDATPDSKDFYRKLNFFNTADSESLNMVKDLKAFCPADTN